MINYEKFSAMWKDELTAEVEFSYPENYVKVKNYSNDVIKIPFGVNNNPNIRDLEDFLEDRCFPRERHNCKEILRELGLMMYDPIEIIKITHGIILEDFMWIKFYGEDLNYEDVRVRTR